MADRLLVSAVLITLNATKTLAATLESLSFCNEILVVDSGSTDGTQQLAASYGARVVFEQWRGFGPQKQFAVEEARNDWVLCIDADEIVSPDLERSIREAMERPTHTAYEFPRCNRFLGRYLKHGEGYPDYCLRLFDRRHARWSDDAVHEQVISLEPVGRLQGDLLHHSEDSIESYLAKQNRYTSLAAQSLVAEGADVSTAKLVVSPCFRFVKFFFLRSGFRDGTAGFIHIVIGCFNSFAKYAKIIEMKKQKRDA